MVICDRCHLRDKVVQVGSYVRIQFSYEYAWDHWDALFKLNKKTLCEGCISKLKDLLNGFFGDLAR